MSDEREWAEIRSSHGKGELRGHIPLDVLLELGGLGFVDKRTSEKIRSHPEYVPAIDLGCDK